MSSRGQVNEQAGLGQVAKPVLISVGIGLVCCIAVLMVFSVVLSARSVPQSLVGPMAIVSMCVGSLVAGFCCAKILRQNGLVYGAVCGAVMSVVVLLASLSISDNGFGMLAVIKIVFMLICAMLGGVLGVNTRGRRKR